MKDAAAILIIAALVCYKIGSAPAAATPAIATTATTRWSIDLAQRLGNAAPSAEMVALLDAWQQAEGGDAAYNPLNTTQNMPDATCYNADPCVKNYASYEDGMAATIATLQGGHAGYADIVAGIQTNDPQRVVDGIAASPWGSSAALITQVYGGMVSAPPQPVGTTTAGDARQRVMEVALSQVGKGYILSTAGPDTFDCSGLVQWSYAQIGIDTTRTTYTQLDALRPIDPSQVQPGDMVYFQYPWDQHVGMLIPGEDGQWAMVHAAAPDLGVIVTQDVFSDPFYADAIIGYRTAL
jgi:cell wall-associated NlpC family hydrolase